MRLATLTLLCAACGGGTGGKTDGDGDGSVTPGGGPADAPCQAPGYYDPVVPVERWVSLTLDDWPAVEWLQDDPIGLVFYFHGSGGQAGDVKFLEPTREIDTFVRAGLSFVSLSSDDRTNGQWDSTDDSWSQNPDLARLNAVYQDLLANGDIAATTPVFTDGFSDGGSMSGFFAAQAEKAGWPVKAAAMHSSGGAASADVPQIWMVAENDLPDVPDHAQAAFQSMTDDGAVTAFYQAEELPLDPMRFLRIPNYTEDQSQFAFDELVDLGMVDAGGVREIDLDTQLESSLSSYERVAKAPQDWEVSGELRVVWSTHRFDSQWTQQVCEFFMDNR